MIDLHIHILPGMDDGPATMEESLVMCRTCLEEGIHTLVATPHIIRDVYDNRPESILAATHTLNKRLDQEGLPLRVCTGADVRLDYDLIERIDGKEVLTLNDASYLLLEIPDAIIQSDLMRTVSGLKRRGIRPIISHPERSPYFQQNIEALYSLVHSDVVLQVTAGSFLGGFGKGVKEFAERLLHHRLVHLLASDAHSPSARPPGLRSAFHRICELQGEEEAGKLVSGNPSHVLRGSPLRLPLPLPWKKRRARWRFGF